jgi:integrase
LISEAVFANEDLAVALRVSAQTGVRRGELVALKWSDFVGDRLSVRRSMVESQGEILITDTKTHSRGHRTISLDAKTVAQLETLRIKQTAIADGHLLPAPVWMFSHDAGVTAWRPEYMTTAFQRLNQTLKFASGCTIFVTSTPRSSSPPVSTSRRCLDGSDTPRSR